MHLADLKHFVEKLLGRSVSASVPHDPAPCEDRPHDSSVHDMIKLLEPPADLSDGSAWDQYWENHLKLGFGPPIFDMGINDSGLVRSMRDAALFKVLCVGNGMSMEPRALAAAGFAVTALDVAPRVTSFASRVPLSDEYIARLLGGAEQRTGGTVEFVTGNALDPTVCPGPYDVIIERRTAQNYLATNSMPQFLSALAGRLGERGLFVSHFHDGGWRPGKPDTHLPGEWFRRNGWLISRGGHPEPVDGRVAWLTRSTG